MKQKLTPWFKRDARPVRVGVYEIRGSRFGSKCYRKWLGYGWSATYSDKQPAGLAKTSVYLPGSDMTGWRGLAEAPK